MTYKIEFSNKALRKLKKYVKNVRIQILDKIYMLKSNPKPRGSLKLRDRSGYRIRSGKYRIIYEIIEDKLVIHVIDVDHRKDIY